MSEDEVTWVWKVEGSEVVSGTLQRPYEDGGTIVAEGMGSALNQLIHRDLWWDTLDTDKAVTITIAPADSGSGGVA